VDSIIQTSKAALVKIELIVDKKTISSTTDIPQDANVTWVISNCSNSCCLITPLKNGAPAIIPAQQKYTYNFNLISPDATTCPEEKNIKKENIQLKLTFKYGPSQTITIKPDDTQKTTMVTQTNDNLLTKVEIISGLRTMGSTTDIPQDTAVNWIISNYSASCYLITPLPKEQSSNTTPAAK